MVQLCLDTSAGAAVAVVQGGVTLALVREPNPRRHAESLTPLVQEAALAAGFDGPLGQVPWRRICVGTGPAPFTGLRAGLMTAVAYGRAWDVPVSGMPSLAIIARQALDVLPEDTRVLAVTDARRHEVYWAQYAADGPNSLTALQPPQVGPPSMLGPSLREGRIMVVGPGTALAQKEFPLTAGPVEEANPAVLARLVSAALKADPDAALLPEPLYLRRPHINR